MKRAGFTMIELIFVIVILGILAAVAVPKLAATRDDAKVAKGATEMATAIGDFGSYYTSKGIMGTAGTMSNVFVGNSTNSTDMNVTGTSIAYEGCISFNSTETVAGGGVDGINVKYTAAGASAICIGIANAAKGITGFTDKDTDSNLTHNFGGTGVVFD